MSSTSRGAVALLFGVHAHQPVGNFPAVIDDALERCYRPFLRTLHRYPEFRFAAHFSGWLLGELLQRFPKDMELLAEMVRRGQVELFGAGDTEPVLAAIPARDRVAQLAAMSDRLERDFGVRPRGAWLTERVWEATVVPALIDAGIRYVVVDDYHFLCTGKAASELDGHFATEEEGRRLDVFPISEALRYRLPFSPAADALRFLEEGAAAGQAAAVYFDDIEKFGIWPETYEWVYAKGWLERFIEGVLASKQVRTATYAEFHASVPGRGIVYLPTTSYIEMNEWTLPAAAARGFGELARREREAGRYEVSKPFVRGGIWRNFLTRFPESNWMHKRMLTLSARLAALGDVPPRAGALREALFRGQANDAYWHGLFGGLYLPHLRRAVWSNLIEVEAGLEAFAPGPSCVRADLDFDGRDEWLLRGEGLTVALRDDGHASLHEFSSHRLGQNFADTLARRREAYHERIGAEKAQAHEGEGIASAHDRVLAKHPIDDEDLAEDARPRTLLLDTLVDPRGRERPLDDYAAPEPAPRFVWAAGGGRIVKQVSLAEGGLTVVWTCTGLAGHRLHTRLNVAMPSCDGFSGRYVLADGSQPCGFGQALEVARAERLTLDDRVLDGWLRLECAPTAAIGAAPYHTVSLSEGGFEKIMQAAVVELSFALTADEATIRLTLTPGR